MNPSVSVFIATSLDGFIARPDGGLDWLDAAQAVVPVGEDCGFASFMETVDVLVMGRKTFEKVRTLGPWPYGATRVIVLSRTPIDFQIAFPDDFPETVTHSSEDPPALCDRLSREGVKHLYVDGGNTIQRFLAAGLVDELTITVIPVLLGKGIPLFGDLDADINLSCVETRRFEFGFVQLKYCVMK